MENPYAPQRTWSKNSKQKTYNNFQSELDDKMRERKRMGLTSDLTPSASERGSDGELGSDDDLMGQFNMTTKNSKPWAPPRSGRSPGLERSSPSSNRSKSPYDSLRRSPASDLIFGKKTPTIDEDEEDEDDYGGPSSLMMTMKKPWNPSTLGKGDASKTLPNPKTRKSKAFDALQEDREDREKTWTPPSYKKQEQEKENNRPLRPKSPRGRKTPNLDLDSIQEEERPPERKTRFSDSPDGFLKPQPKPRGRASPMRHRGNEDDEEMMMLSARGDSPDRGMYGRSKDRYSPDRKTPSDDRRTPNYDRKTPTNDRRTPTESKLNLFGRKTPTRDSLDERESPYNRRRSPKDGRGDGRKSPADGRRTPKDGRKTPSDGRRTPLDGRGTPKAASRRRDRNEEDEKVQKKSMMDMFSSASPQPNKGKKEKKKKSLLHLSDDDSDDVGMGAPRRSPDRNHRSPDERSRNGRRDRDTPDDEVDGFRIARSPSLKSPGYRHGSPSQEDRRRRRREDEDYGDEDEGRRSAFRPTPTRRKEERGRSQSRGEPAERESSTCRDVTEDPGMRKQQETVKQKKLAKAHTTAGRDLENAISSVEIAQDKTMRFIQPDDEATNKEKESKEEKSSPDKPDKSRKHRPKPRYPAADTQTPRPEDFSSTTDIKQAVYNEWYAERMRRAKEEAKAKKAMEKEQEDHKKKEAEEKYVNAKASYQAWMESKKDYDQNRKKKILTEEEKKMKKLEDEQEKQKEATLCYRSWKDEKDAKIREQQRKKKREEERKQEDEENEKNMKKKDSKSAYEGWKHNKDKTIQKNLIKTKKTLTQKQQEELEETRQRERESRDSYERWMARKEKRELSEKKKRRHLEEEETPRPAWSPANRTIPFGR